MSQWFVRSVRAIGSKTKTYPPFPRAPKEHRQKRFPAGCQRIKTCLVAERRFIGLLATFRRSCGQWQPCAAGCGRWRNRSGWCWLTGGEPERADKHRVVGEAECSVSATRRWNRNPPQVSRASQSVLAVLCGGEAECSASRRRRCCRLWGCFPAQRCAAASLALCLKVLRQTQTLVCNRPFWQCRVARVCLKNQILFCKNTRSAFTARVLPVLRPAAFALRRGLVRILSSLSHLRVLNVFLFPSIL